MKKARLGTIATAGLLSTVIALAGCAADDPEDNQPPTSAEGHDGMDHPADGGPVPEGMAGYEALLADPETRTRMGAAGRARIEREFRMERIVDQFEAVHQALLGAAR